MQTTLNTARQYKEDLEAKKQDRIHRLKWAQWMLVTVLFYLGGTFVIVIFQHWWPITPAIVLMLLGTNMVNITGLLFIITKYLFK